MPQSFSTSQSNKHLSSLALSALGVVFGDIGTSPLYAIKEVFNNNLPLDQPHILGVLSLVFWSLTLVVVIKYSVFIMRANNKGEGGIMALLALALFGAPDRQKALIVVLGLIGAALFYGDSMITPAISVLSAVEGLEIVAPQFQHFLVPVTITVLFLLFIVQPRGTAEVGKFFSPVMCVWFATLAVLGVSNIINEPSVLMALNPAYALQLLFNLGWHSFLILGAVVLAITGAEALYADMGQFGLKPIRWAWFGIVFPALICNYFGQGALLLQNPAAVQNPFYLLAPAWAGLPLMILATLATVIASQAVISGAFSITRQAVQLGYCPRMTIIHTSGDEVGQVFIPTVNWMLMVAVFLLVVAFQSSSALASAYGIAVTGTMLVTTILAFFVIQRLWQWRPIASLLFLAIFLTVDLLFFSANCLKIVSGGWLPLLVGAAIFLVMTTWVKGRALLNHYMAGQKVLFEELEDKLKDHELATVKGSAIYLTRTLQGVPPVLLHNLKHNHVLHEQIVVLTIVTTDEPYVDEGRRVKIRCFGQNRNFYRVKLYYGFDQSQDVRRALSLSIEEGLGIDPKNVSFFVGNQNITFKRTSPMPKWQQPLFLYMVHNASSAIEYFSIPVDQVMEIGIRVEL